MAHQLKITQLPPVEVLNTDVIIEVRIDEALLGRLALSRGNLEWTPASLQPIRLTWRQFDELMRGRAE